MADSTFWRELAREFRALPEDATFADQIIQSSTDPFGNDSTETRRWMLHSNSHYVAMQFEALARRAGDGFSPNAEDSFHAWMDALWGFGENVDTHKDAFGREPHVFVEVKKRIRDLSQTSSLLCSHLEITAFNGERRSRTQPTTRQQKEKRSVLRDRYFASFPEKIKILDVCWAAGEHYREWKRWLQQPSPVKDGSKPDLAFRAILMSNKRPLEYRPIERPPDWQ